MQRLFVTLTLAGLAAPAMAGDGRAEIEGLDARIDLREAALAQPEAEAPVDFAQQGLWEGWSGDVYFGLTGSDGNTQRLSLRLGASANKETTNWRLTNSVAYANSEDDGDESEDRFRLTARQDRKLGDSPWSWFLQEQYTYDEFDSFLHRLELQVGARRQLIDEEDLKLAALGGLGARYDTGNGAEPGWVPEAFIGGEYEQKLTERQNLVADSTVFIQLDETEARWVTNVAWEVLMDESVNLNLRAGIRNEYDSSSTGNTRKNDVDFFVLLSFDY